MMEAMPSPAPAPLTTEAADARHPGLDRYDNFFMTHMISHPFEQMLAALSMIAGANPLALQAQFPSREAAEKYTDEAFQRTALRNDANDIIYQLDSSRTYNPWPNLEKIRTPMLWINSADDFINPSNYGITERAMKRMPTTKFILIPASSETKGHGTHTWAKFWKDDLARLLAQ